MRTHTLAILLGALTLAGTATAQTTAPGQTTVTPVRPSTPAQGRAKSAAPVPSARVLGVPVAADAPVSPSYDGTAYKTLGGQAETGEDAISGQVMQPTGADTGRPR